MGKVKIMIKTSTGEEYPCKLTLGAMRRFKAETGKDVSNMDGAADMAVLMWCCTVSECAVEGVKMPWGLDEFCDRMDMESIGEFSSILNDGEKKIPMKEAK
jgi:hypothetical protein